MDDNTFVSKTAVFGTSLVDSISNQRQLPPSFQHRLVASVAILVQASYQVLLLAVQVLLLQVWILVLGFWVDNHYGALRGGGGIWAHFAAAHTTTGPTTLQLWQCSLGSIQGRA